MVDASALPTLTDPDLAIEEIVSGLSSPTTMDFLAKNDILVLEKNTGHVMRVLDGVLQPIPVLDAAVSNTSERGMLGIVIIQTNPKTVYLYYTEATIDGGSPLGNRVYKYFWNQTSTMLENPVLVKDLPALPGPNHDGGILISDSDDNVFAVIGDLNRNGILQNFPTGDPDDTSVIIPVDPTGPYIGMGIRNSFGLTIDPVTGFMWITENGPGSYDEINLVTEKYNSGWQDIMGPIGMDPIPPPVVIDGNGTYIYSDPEFSWFDTNAPTAISFIESASFPSIGNAAVVGDNNSGQLYRFPLNPARTEFNFTGFPSLEDLVADNNSERDLLSFGSGFGAITDIKVGTNCEFFVVSISQGKIYRVYPVECDVKPDSGTPYVSMGTGNTTPQDGSLAIADFTSGNLTQLSNSLTGVSLDGIAFKDNGDLFATNATHLFEVNATTGGLLSETLMTKFSDGSPFPETVIDLTADPAGTNQLDILSFNGTQFTYNILREDGSIRDTGITSRCDAQVGSLAWRTPDSILFTFIPATIPCSAPVESSFSGLSDDAITPETVPVITLVEREVIRGSPPSLGFINTWVIDKFYDGLAVDSDGGIFATHDDGVYELDCIAGSPGSCTSTLVAGNGTNPDDVDFVP